MKDDSNNRLQLVGGYAGQVWQLEDGSDDDGYTIISDLTRKDRVLGVGRNEIRGIAFNYELPDDSSLSGISLYLTPSLSSSATTYQTALTFEDVGWKYSNFSSDTERKGHNHKIRLRVPGRINLFREILWIKPAPWAH
jgi:hypothetical protein